MGMGKGRERNALTKAEIQGGGALLICRSLQFPPKLCKRVWAEPADPGLLQARDSGYGGDGGGPQNKTKAVWDPMRLTFQRLLGASGATELWELPFILPATLSPDSWGTLGEPSWSLSVQACFPPTKPWSFGPHFPLAHIFILAREMESFGVKKLKRQLGKIRT